MSKYEPTRRQLQVEAELILNNGDKAKASNKLGITRATLNSTMQRLAYKRQRLARMGTNGK